MAAAGDDADLRSVRVGDGGEMAGVSPVARRDGGHQRRYKQGEATVSVSEWTGGTRRSQAGLSHAGGQPPKSHPPGRGLPRHSLWGPGGFHRAVRADRFMVCVEPRTPSMPRFNQFVPSESRPWRPPAI
jgi:hypothetical protein